MREVENAHALQGQAGLPVGLVARLRKSVAVCFFAGFFALASFTTLRAGFLAAARLFGFVRFVLVAICISSTYSIGVRYAGGANAARM